MSEAQVESPAVTAAENAGFFCRKVQWVGRVSAPDRIFARKDRGEVWVEFKDEGKEATPAQAREHRRMRAAGMEVHVCDNLRDFRRILGI